MTYGGVRQPLFARLPEFFLMPNDILGHQVASLCRSSSMRSIQSFELDENCILTERIGNGQLHFDQASQLTNLQISFWNFNQCIHVLNQLGSQLHSLTVTIAFVSNHDPDMIYSIKSVSEIFRFYISMN
jgi:hypothetical protein